MDVHDAAVGLIGCRDRGVVDWLPGRIRIGDRVDGQILEIAGVDEILQGLRRFLLVRGVLIDNAAERMQDCPSASSLLHSGQSPGTSESRSPPGWR